MSRLLVPVVLVGVVLAGLIGVNIVSAAEVPEECSTSGATLREARTAYAASCTLPRIDCDPIAGTWYCSSRVIGAAAPGGVSAADVGASQISHEAVMPPTTAQPSSTTTAPPPSPPPVDPPTPAPPAEAPTAPTDTKPPTLPQPSTPDPGDTTTTTAPAETTTTSSSVATTATTAPAPPAAACGVVAIEAESLPVNGAWKVVADARASGGRYITWEGLSHERNNSRPADIISTDIRIEVPGSYRFTWAMRQPDGVESDKANDSWLNVPDADRFGPDSGGSYGGFIKVFGNSTGSFAYKGTADVNHKKSTISIEFDRAGTYTLQIAGRSHGHQIDRIVLHHESISRNNAIAGRGGDCGQMSTPATTTTAPATTTTTAASAPSGSCAANTSGTANRSKDLISLHYDHAPDRDDGHATVAGREVASAVGFTPWVIGGAYGADNARTYNSASERVMDATWGANGWVNAHADWNGAVRRTADRWQRTLDACGDIWIAEGGQSDLSADVVRELTRRMPGLDTTARIHLVQHSDWNEEKALDADLAYVKANTDYIRIPDGNRGGNGTADLNDERYSGPFLDAARQGDHAAGWAAAFDYYDPERARLDFSDTVELLHILGIGTNQVNGINDFARTFMN
ncbi:MAG: hypothetical protein AAF467_08295 [Actinomycetota bacterium]